MLPQLLSTLLAASSFVQATQVIVNCTWPCPVEGQVCVVTNTSVQCDHQQNSQWVLSQPTRSPIFMGETARKYTPCVTPPNPILPEASQANSSSIHANQSIISWPPTDSNRPYDEYFSDCVSGTFCSASHICIEHFSDGEPCQSTNQCNAETSRCYQGYCTNMATDSPWAEQQQSNAKSHTAVIVAVVIGVLILLAVPAAAFYYYHRRKRLMAQLLDKQQSSIPPPPPAPPIILSDEPASSTPTMQQQALQYQLQLWQNAHDSKDVHPPPPPYSP